MKIFSWNCNGAFRKKYELAFHTNSDIYIIQECEDPSKFIDSVDFSNYKYYWVGDNPNKGLSIIYKDKLHITLLDFNSEFRGKNLKWFLPVQINSDLQVIGVWTHKANAKAFAYIGQFWQYLQNNKSKLNTSIIAGDFNSNTIWDSWDRWWNHSDCVNELKSIDIVSVYHHIYNELQGTESIKTLFHRKNPINSYHIDYIFSSRILLNKTVFFEVSDFHNWNHLSDHVPIVWEFDN